MRTLSYARAINEGLHQIMERDERTIQIGVGVNTPFYVGQTMVGLLDRFGDARMIDTPVSENGITGVAIGAALTGLRPILTFPRLDFMHYAMDQIANHAAILNSTFGGRAPVGLTIRAIINRGGEQGAQHSQATQALFAHLPGLRVVAPSDPRDAKGMLIAAVEHGGPVVYIEDRWLYAEEGEVDEECRPTPLDGARVVREGSDLTMVASSYMVHLCRRAAEELAADGVSVEVIDLRSLKPLDSRLIAESVKKTGCALVADGGPAASPPR
jgi:pyruvate/2-oxoglutarate/acetoin dehydrogenase E1 component